MKLSHSGREDPFVPPDDRQLIAAFQAGEYRAFDVLYQRYARRVLGFAYHLTGDAAEAEDLTQEVFLAAFKGMHAFRSRSQILTWLLSIAMRRWRDVNRRCLPETVPFPDDIDVTGRAEISRWRPESDDRVERVALQAVVERLREPLRQVFLLVVVQELTYREAAEVLGCPIGTIKSRVATALREVRASLQVKEEDHVPCLLP
jgi:RNA polymerase sigma-70 factor (ECF subfamily)